MSRCVCGYDVEPDYKALATDALRALAEAAEWLETRPDYSEGDAATASAAREVLARPEARALMEPGT